MTLKPTKGQSEKESDIHQGNGKGLGSVFAQFSEKNGRYEKPEAMPVTKAVDNNSKQGV